MTITAIFKAEDDDEQLVFAEVYAPMIADSDGEFMDAPTIRNMAYDFMRQMGLDQIDSQHDNNLVQGCVVVESFIARKGDPLFIEGAWVVGMHIDNADMWAKIKKGEINGFSVEAIVHKEETTVKVNLPPTCTGMTMPAGDPLHSHTFNVSYGVDGTFLGGSTNVVDGHSHNIRKGTATEVTAGHNHRFSHVDNLVMEEV